MDVDLCENVGKRLLSVPRIEDNRDFVFLLDFVFLYRDSVQLKQAWLCARLTKRSINSHHQLLIYILAEENWGTSSGHQ